MKKRLPFFLLNLALLSSFNLPAQTWVSGVNTISSNGTLGTTTNFSVIFKTNNSERGRITNTGLWGFGTTAPNSKVHISSPSGQVPLRIDENGFTQLLVSNGVTIGSNSTTPPASGLYVKGNTGIGTSAPGNKLHVFNGSAGTVTGHPQAPLIVENSTNSYIHILAPDVSETGILFGRPNSGVPGGNVDGGIIYNSAGTPGGLQFRTNGNTTRMIVNSKGQLGVSIDPGLYKMKVLVGDLFAIDGFGIANVAGDEWGLTPVAGNLNLAYQRDLRGTFNPVNGAYSSISDERLKTNIRPMGAMLEKIRLLKPSTYEFKNTTDKQEYNGFIAQDVMQIFPGMVMHSVDPKRTIDVYTVDYSQFGVLASKGIQELQPIIEEQKETIAALEDRYKLEIAMLEDRLAKMERVLATMSVYENGHVPAVTTTNASPGQNKHRSFNKNATTVTAFRKAPGINKQVQPGR